MNDDVFFRPPVTSAQSIIGTEKYPDAGIIITYDGDYSQQNGRIKEAFEALTKSDILKPFK